MAGWLHGVFVGEWPFVFPLCGFSLSLFCNYCKGRGEGGGGEEGGGSHSHTSSGTALLQLRVCYRAQPTTGKSVMI